MTTKVLITRQADNRFTARALALPDVIASGSTEDEAVAHLRATLTDLQARSRVLDVDLPLPETTATNSLARLAGIWADDPDWEAFQDAIAEHRREIDEQFTPA